MKVCFAITFLLFYCFSRAEAQSSYVERAHFDALPGVPFYKTNNKGSLSSIALNGNYRLSLDFPEGMSFGMEPIEAGIDDLLDEESRKEVEDKLERQRTNMELAFTFLDQEGPVLEGKETGNKLIKVRVWDKETEKEVFVNEDVYADLLEAHKDRLLNITSIRRIKDLEASSVENCENCAPKENTPKENVDDIVDTTKPPVTPSGDPNMPELASQDPEVGYCKPKNKKETMNSLFGYSRNKMLEKVSQARGKANAKAKISNAERDCRKEVKKYSCRNNDWRGLSLMERLEAMNDEVEDVFAKAKFPKNTGACLASRETGNLNINSLTMGHCSSKTYSSAWGLFHITNSTLAEFMLKKQFADYVRNPEISNTLKQSIKKSVSEKSLSTKQANELISYLTSREGAVYPSGSYSETAECKKISSCQVNLVNLQKLMKDNPKLQAIVAMTILKVKRANRERAISPNSNFSSSDLITMLKNYHGSSDSVNQEYADSIYSCIQCMEASDRSQVYEGQKMSKENKHRCMALTLKKTKDLGEPTLERGRGRLNFELYNQYAQENCSC
ncbi:MAG: hypothetical protein VX583_11305 [Bdellovibrionota bacterium]|nr:hypothetical protein [Pseudobdellovibrionaceae bacterium]|tara:strand:- start:61052 stop:62728 length:1677 start_codon:yes stop_codon:yes gene_type:complete